MDVRGKAYINKGQYGFYTTVKDREDTKFFLTVGFRKGQEPDEGGEFNLKNAFLSAYPTRSGEARLKLVVLDYEQVGEIRVDDARGSTPQKSPNGETYHPATKFEKTDLGGDLPF